MDYRDMSSDHLAGLIENAKNELVRRENIALLGERLALVQDEFRDAGILPAPPSKWERPAESRDAYGRGDVVDWGEGQRESTAGFVVCMPDCDEHWIDYVRVETVADSDHDSEITAGAIAWEPDVGYLRGGTIVSFQGKVFRVKSAHTSREEWVPNAMPGLFEEVRDAEIS